MTIPDLPSADQAARDDSTLAFQNGIATMMTGTLDLAGILDRIAELVTRVMQARACSIRLLNKHTGELKIKAVYNLSHEYLSKGAIRLDKNPIDKAAVEGRIVYVRDAAKDPRTLYPEQARREGIVSCLSAGMMFRGQTIGVMRVYMGTEHEFTAEEKTLLCSIAWQAAAAIINSRLYLEVEQAHRYQQQISYAGDIQRRMIPHSAPEHSALDLASVYNPSFDVGGDYFDFLTFSDPDEIGLCIADVVGKGIPAALLMASLRTAFRLYAHATLEITEALTMTNMYLCRETLPGEFASIFYGVFSEDARQLTYCNAGHDPPLLCRRGHCQALSAEDMILGVRVSESYHKKRLSLQRGDAIVFYTDGVVDATNFKGESFGRRRLQGALRRNASEPAGRLAQQLIWDIRRFVGLADQADDITLVAAKIR